MFRIRIILIRIRGSVYVFLIPKFYKLKFCKFIIWIFSLEHDFISWKLDMNVKFHYMFLQWNIFLEKIQVFGWYNIPIIWVGFCCHDGSGSRRIRNTDTNNTNLENIHEILGFRLSWNQTKSIDTHGNRYSFSFLLLVVDNRGTAYSSR